MTRLNTNLTNLQNLAEALLTARRAKRRYRPIVVEFAGSPKSGKTSCIAAMDLFFRRNGYVTKLIGEKAHISPVLNKKDPFYNLWTFSSTAADLAATLGGPKGKEAADIVLIDRGFFDAYCWFSWLYRNNHLSDEDFKRIEPYVLLPKWISSIDLVIAFTTSPTKSLEREHKNLLTKKTGSIMNSRVLKSFNETILHCHAKKAQLFRSIELIDASKNDLITLNYNVTLKTLQALSSDLKEPIGYVSIQDLTTPMKAVQSFNRLGITEGIIKYEARETVEIDPEKIQLVPIVVITNKAKDHVFVVSKTKKTNVQTSPEHNKLLPYLGGHLRREDIPGGIESSMFKTLNRCLQREVKEEIGLDYVPTLSAKSMYIWINDNPIKQKTKQHIAIVDIWEVDFNDFRFKLDSQEFSSSRISPIMSIEKLLQLQENLEEWGINILKYIFNKKISWVVPGGLFNSLEALD